MKQNKQNNNSFMKIDMKKIYPHIIAILVFFIVSAVYFSPVIQGKKLFQSDMMNYYGVVKSTDDYKKSTGESVSWTDAIFSGMPSYQISGPSTNNIFNTISSPLKLWGFELDLGVMFLYMLGFYVFCIALGLSPWIGILSGIAFALASYNIIIIEVGHITKAWAMAMMSPIFGAMLLVFKKKYLSGGVLFCVALGLQLTFNHIQITYYTMLAGIIMGLVYFVYAIKEKQVKQFFLSFLTLIAASLIAILPLSANLMLNSEYVSHTMRGGSDLTIVPKGEKQTNNVKGLTIDYAFSWSYGIGESLSILIPDARGGGSSDQRYEANAENRIKTIQTTQPLQQGNQNINQIYNQYVASSYWGEQPFTAGTMYFGAIIIFLALLGFLLIKGANFWWLLLATILSFILSWGNNALWINQWLFENLPFYNKFRTPSMALVLANVTLIIAGVLGLKAFFSKDISIKKKQKALYISGALLGGITILCAIFPSLFANFSSSKDALFEQVLGTPFIDALIQDRKDLFSSDAFRSFVFIALAFITLFLYLSNKIKKEYIVLLALIVFVLVDLWSVDKRYLTDNNFKQKQDFTLYPTSADENIYAINKERNINHYRVMNLSVNTFNDATTSYFHPSIGGYHGAKLQRYQDIIDFYLANPNYKQKDLTDTTLLRNNPLRQFYNMYQGQVSANMGVLNMLDAKYLIVPSQNGPMALYNPEALGAAWFVPQIKWADNANEEILLLDNFNPKQEAIVDIKFKDIIKNVDNNSYKDTNATIVFERDEFNNPEYLKYTTNSTTDQIMICSEIYYNEDWKAYIDGKETPYFRADYILRGIIVPKGKHVIEFKLVSPTYKVFNFVSLVGSILVVLFVLLAIFYPYIKKRKNDEKNI
ncbi:MAG: YfhO family protein [Bacteroidales bacterium]|jgi:uncharacterized protein YxeA|nr:YfhO family protein [Bacteroidales bacterium]